MTTPSAVVVDANVVIAALLRSGSCRHILLFGSTRFFAPPFLFQELENHWPEIEKRSGVAPEVVRSLLGDIRQRLTEIPAASILAHWNAAEELRHADSADTAYLAAALATGLPIWTLDKRLAKVFGRRSVSTRDLM